MFGHDPAGTRDNTAEHQLTAATVRSLHVDWRFASPGGPVYGTPVIADGVVYDADFAGDVFALDAGTGAVKWLTHPSAPGGFPAAITSSPLVTSSDVIVGDQNGFVWAFDRTTGLLRWTQRPNTYLPAIWGSPTLVTVHTTTGERELVLVPIASNEETLTATSQQPCCRARGSVAALDPQSGAIVWQTYTISPTEAAAGAAGASVWTTPAYDASLNAVFIATGNNFANKPGARTTRTSDAVIALDASNGAVRWVNQRTQADTWTGAFTEGPQHPDYDFGDSPEIFRLGSGRLVVAAGQKSGFLHLFDAATGRTLDQRQFFPSGELGGYFADSAVDGDIVFGDGNDWPAYGHGELGGLLGTVAGQVEGAAPPKYGAVVATRARASGRWAFVWRFTTPGKAIVDAVAVAAGIVYVEATQDRRLYALDEQTGSVLARVDTGPSVSGPAVADGAVYLGYGDTFGFTASDPTKGGIERLVP